MRVEIQEDQEGPEAQFICVIALQPTHLEKLQVKDEGKKKKLIRHISTPLLVKVEANIGERGPSLWQCLDTCLIGGYSIWPPECAMTKQGDSLTQHRCASLNQSHVDERNRGLQTHHYSA